MSKRDDLDKEARGEMGVFGALLLGGIAAAGAAGHAVAKSNKKDNLKVQIDNKQAEISSIERQISEEESKFFLIRDASSISSLKQKRNKLVNEKNDLLAQYNKL